MNRMSLTKYLLVVGFFFVALTVAVLVCIPSSDDDCDCCDGKCCPCKKCPCGNSCECNQGKPCSCEPGKCECEDCPGIVNKK